MEVYEKVGKRYKKIGYQFTGFPADGVWLVSDGRQSLIMRVGDLPDPMPLASIQRHEDAATMAISELFKDKNKGWSISDIWNAICMAIAREEQK